MITDDAQWTFARLGSEEKFEMSSPPHIMTDREEMINWIDRILLLGIMSSPTITPKSFLYATLDNENAHVTDVKTLVFDSR